MRTDVALAKRSYLLWTKKYEGLSYSIWIKYLRPLLGQSLKKTGDAIAEFNPKSRHIHQYSAFRKKLHKIYNIAGKMSQTMAGAQMTFCYLYHLAKYRKKQLLSWRNKSK